MLTIRLSRIGKKKKPMYRLIISEKTKDPYGNALEILGSWNPFSKELAVKNDRIEYWRSKGAQMSPTVNNILVDKGIIKEEKVKASGSGKKAAQAAKAAAAEANKEKQAAKAAAAEAPVAAEEVKTEETK